jgi:hypothetical protein
LQQSAIEDPRYADDNIGDNDLCVGVIISAPFSVIARMSSRRIPNFPTW